MPPRLGIDADDDGLTDYANSAAEFEEEEAEAGGFRVELVVRPDLCKRAATYTWRSTAGETEETGGRGCRVTQTFPAEGRYPVELTVRSPGGKTRSYHREIAVRDWLIVSIGDSVASGEGNPDIPSEDGEKARWQSRRCHRSAKAAPAQAALALEAAEPQTSTTFVHLACSGAKVSEGLLDPYKGLEKPRLPWAKPLDPQVDELESIDDVRDVDAVLLSIGANDVYFGPIVTRCLLRSACTEKRFKPKDKRVPKGPLAEVVEKAIALLNREYDHLAHRLSNVVAPSHVVITEYFDPTHNTTGEFCERIEVRLARLRLRLDKAEAEWAASKILQPLNEKIATEAAAHKWTDVSGVAEAFRNHGYCAGEDTWIVQFKESSSRQAGGRFFSRFAGFLHPNKRGHEVEGAMIGRALDKVLAGESLPARETQVVLVTEAHEDEDESSGEEAAEEAAAIALLGGVGAGGLIVVGAAARRRRRDDRRRNQDEAEPEPPPLDPPHTLADRKSVRAYGELLENLPDWVHRRVEAIEILDEKTVRRRVSVDFTPRLPRWKDLRRAPAVTHAPIALLAKRVLSRFDLRDESGASVPLATARENAAFATAYMLELARGALREEPPQKLRRLCWTIARGGPAEATEAIAALRAELPPGVSQALREDQRFRAATSTFAENFAILVEVDREQPERRRVLKLAYDQVMGPVRLRWWQKLGLAPVLMKFRIPELGDAASRHLEFVRVAGLDILSAQLVWQEPSSAPQGIEGVRRGGDAHVRINRKKRGTRALAGVRVRASRSSLLVGGPWIAALSAGALTAAWFALPGLAGDSSGNAPEILLAIPAFFGVYLGTRQPHPLEAELLRGARFFVYSSGFLAFAAAVAIAVEPAPGPLRILLGVAALLAWFTVAILTLIWMQPSFPIRSSRRRLI
jgi:hypothetical protein